MAFTETLTQFFNDRDFAQSATFNDVSAGSSTTVKGIFENESANVEVGEIEIEATAPRFICALSDVTNAVENDTFEINSVTYKVAGPIIKDEAAQVATIILKD